MILLDHRIIIMHIFLNFCLASNSIPGRLQLAFKTELSCGLAEFLLWPCLDPRDPIGTLTYVQYFKLKIIVPFYYLLFNSLHTIHSSKTKGKNVCKFLVAFLSQNYCPLTPPKRILKSDEGYWIKRHFEHKSLNKVY